MFRGTGHFLRRNERPLIIVIPLAVAVAIGIALIGDHLNLAERQDFVGTMIPRWITAIIAIFALFAAWTSVNSQREIARKRAAMDFFAKTEMDKYLLDAHKRYTEAIERMKKALEGGQTLKTYVAQGDGDYWSIRGYLNLHELMSVGIKNEIFDDDVCFYYWSGELIDCYSVTQDLITEIQSLPNEENTYCEMLDVAERWIKKKSASGTKGAVMHEREQMIHNEIIKLRANLWNGIAVAAFVVGALVPMFVRKYSFLHEVSLIVGCLVLAVLIHLVGVWSLKQLK